MLVSLGLVTLGLTLLGLTAHAMSALATTVAVTGYGLVYLGLGAAGPNENDLLHRRVDASGRATALSVQSLSLQLVAAGCGTGRRLPRRRARCPGCWPPRPCWPEPSSGSAGPPPRSRPRAPYRVRRRTVPQRCRRIRRNPCPADLLTPLVHRS